MLAGVLQPNLISIFSSTNSNPTLLFSSEASTTLVEDSFISLLNDHDDGEEILVKWNGKKQQDRNLKTSCKNDLERVGNLSSKVLLIQSPEIKSTFIKIRNLSINLNYLNFVVKNLNQSFFFDLKLGVGLNSSYVVLRFANWLTEASYRPSNSSTSPLPLYLIPLHFPSPSPHLLTNWTTITLNLPSLLSSCAKLSSTSNNLMKFKSLESITVHANCRLKKIWSSDCFEGSLVDEGMVKRGMRSEFGLFAWEGC